MDAMTQREVQASPEVPLFTLHVVVDWTAPQFLDIGSALKAEAEKIGINIELHHVDVGRWWDIMFGDTTWNVTWDEGGWDMDLGGWYDMATDLIWFEGYYASWGQLPFAWNYYGWENEKADRLLRLGMSTLDPELRKEFIWKWQEEFMHDAPNVNMFYMSGWEVTAADLEGWDFTGWWYAAEDLKRTGTTLEDDVTLKYGTEDDPRILNPMFLLSIADETLADQTFDMLMTPRLDPVTGAAILVPELAREDPVYSPDGKSVTVYLRDDVEWHDNVKFNATDVKFTFEAVIDPATVASGHGDFVNVIDWVEIVDEYTVIFHLKAPAAHFNTLLANAYGATIIPEHILRDVPRKNWKRHVTNTETPMPGTGPYKFVEWVKDEFWLVEANKDYFKGEPMVDRIYNLVIPDATTQLIALQTHEIDFGSGWSATIAEIENMKLDPTLKVTLEVIPGVIFWAFQLRHPILSNRYVRQAFAHVVPYEHVINDILPLMGLIGERATAPVNPIHGYLYNTELQPYEYNIDIAKQYLDMWRGLDPDNPAYIGYPTAEGDADFSGLVDLSDFGVWAANFGKTKDEWPWHSGDGVDPDFDNDRDVDLFDFERWRLNWGKEYPFKGAR